MPKGHLKHIRIIRIPSRDSMKGRAAVIVMNRKGIMRVFVMIYASVQTQARGSEPAERTRVVLFWVEQQLMEIASPEQNKWG